MSNPTNKQSKFSNQKSSSEFYKILFQKIKIPFSPDYANIEDILYSKHLASLGDALVNYCYSVARFAINPLLTSSVRVWDSSLATAIRQSPFNSYIKKRISQGELGDCVEAIVAWTYMIGAITLENIIEILKQNLPQELLKNKKIEKDGATFAFISLLEHLYSLDIFKSLLEKNNK